MRLAVLAVLALSAAVGWGATSSARQPGVAPVGSPARCLAVAVVLTTSEEGSIRMGESLLTIAEGSGVSEAETAGTRRRVQESRQVLDRARAVRTHFAAAPMDRTTAEHLDRSVSVGDLRTELAQCAERTSAAPVQSRVVNGFLREDGQDRAGNDLGMIEVRTDDFEACRVMCAANSQCRAFNLYTPPPRDKSYCWLKHAAGPARSDPNSVGGVRQ